MVGRGLRTRPKHSNSEALGNVCILPLPCKRERGLRRVGFGLVFFPKRQPILREGRTDSLAAVHIFTISRSLYDSAQQKPQPARTRNRNYSSQSRRGRQRRLKRSRSRPARRNGESC